MEKVFFAPKMEGYSTPYEHPLFEDEVFIPPVSYLEYYKEYHYKHVYWKCPAWQKYYKNCYVIFSQKDIEINYKKESGEIHRDSFEHCVFDEGVEAGLIAPFTPNGPQIHHTMPYHGVAVGQIRQHYVFWSESKNKHLWVEIISPPDLLRTHGLEIISAEYPFSRWLRPSLFAFKFHNESTVLKRGSPLGIVRFKDVTDHGVDFNLERKNPSDAIKRKSQNHSLLKYFLPNKSWSMIKDEPESSGCPFSKFWKKFK